MIRELVNYLENKKILILGFGLEGQSTYKFIRKYLKNKTLYIADQKEQFYKENSLLDKEKNAVYISGEKYLDNLKDYDLIIKTPGISFAKINIEEFENKIKSQLELLLEFFDVYTIGITGTKGKSTTSSLIYEVLKRQEIECMFLGNIGLPVFDYIDQIKEKTTLVLEMSSHQLEYMNKSTNIAILLNIYEEHLDHYKTLNSYADAKCNIFKYQSDEDYFLYNIDSQILERKVNEYKIKSKKYKISIKDNTNESDKVILIDNKVYLNNKKLYNQSDKRKLLGKYNLSNIMFVLTISEILKLDLNKTIETINDFEPLPHRIEKVGEFNGITYYNDAIATIPEATINSVEALEKVNTLIIGGMDRGVSFDNFIKYLNESNIENLICMPKTGHDIGKKIENKRINVTLVETIEEAVILAKNVTKKGTICLLSPAAASYGFFKNFKEKGDTFKRLVREEKV